MPEITLPRGALVLACILEFCPSTIVGGQIWLPNNKYLALALLNIATELPYSLVNSIVGYRNTYMCTKVQWNSSNPVPSTT